MNHIVRTEAKRIYAKIRSRLASGEAENISPDANDLHLTAEIYRKKTASQPNNN